MPLNIRFLAPLVLSSALVGCQHTSRVPAGSSFTFDGPIAEDAHFVAAFQEVEAWQRKGAFPGAVLAIGVGGKLVALRAFGRLDSSEDAPAMPVDAIFDVASLTKVAAATTSMAVLYSEGRVKLDDPVVRYLPEFAGPRWHESITVRHLLSHSSGLPSPILLWKHAATREQLLNLVYQLPGEQAPGTHVDYRDENFILLGELMERVSGQPLSELARSKVFGPLGMKDTGFRPAQSLLPRIAPTELDTYYRHVLVKGTVHDESAHVMGGVSGNAGLFSTASDLARLAQMYLNGGSLNGVRLLSPEVATTFLSRQDLPAGSSRALGWDTPVGNAAPFAGQLASADAVMHTGFTGTSVYIDRTRNAYVVLLTNRVNPSRENRQIGQARIAIHTAVLKALDGR